MAQYKLKKGQTIGALAAESDNLLAKVFIDTGYLTTISDLDDPHFLVLGRTGIGKTALLNQINGLKENCSILDPEELSMQYLHSNMIIKTVMNWGIHLDIFFKYLWRHIITLELIKMRYGENSEDKNKIMQKIRSILYPDQANTQKAALEYLDKHGSEYWVTADTHIKAFTTELEKRLKEDSILGGKFTSPLFSLNSSDSQEESFRQKEIIETEIIERTQTLVNDYQVAALNEIIKKLATNSFNDNQNKYYLLIDDLDKNWMPDDFIYLELIKSLLYTVRDINQKLIGVKIIVSLRSNIYYRIFKKTKQLEPQREKWQDVVVNIIWNENEISEFVNKRFAEFFRGQYTKKPPTIEDVFPCSKRKNTDSWHYLLERTFYRPRDIIEFINICLKESEWTIGFTWKHITTAEISYSQKRLNSVIDEWKDSFFGLPAIFSFLAQSDGSFAYEDLDEAAIIEILTYKDCNKCNWLSRLYEGYSSESLTFEEIRTEILQALYITGLVGLKDKTNHKVEYSFEKEFNAHNHSLNELNGRVFVIHKMFDATFGIKRNEKR